MTSGRTALMNFATRLMRNRTELMFQEVTVKRMRWSNHDLIWLRRHSRNIHTIYARSFRPHPEECAKRTSRRMATDTERAATLRDATFRSLLSMRRRVADEYKTGAPLRQAGASSGTACNRS